MKKDSFKRRQRRKFLSHSQFCNSAAWAYKGSKSDKRGGYVNVQLFDGYQSVDFQYKANDKGLRDINTLIGQLEVAEKDMRAAIEWVKAGGKK